MSTAPDGVSDTTWSKISSILSEGLFKLSYGVGFGLTLPVAFVAKILPQDNCVAWGLIDGAQVAYETANRDGQAP